MRRERPPRPWRPPLAQPQPPCRLPPRRTSRRGGKGPGAEGGRGGVGSRGRPGRLRPLREARGGGGSKEAGGEARPSGARCAAALPSAPSAAAKGRLQRRGRAPGGSDGHPPRFTAERCEQARRPRGARGAAAACGRGGRPPLHRASGVTAVLLGCREVGDAAEAERQHEEGQGLAGLGLDTSIHRNAPLTRPRHDPPGVPLAGRAAATLGHAPSRSSPA